MDKKRLLLLILFVLITAVLGVLLYIVFFKKADPTTIPTINRVPPNSKTSELPSSGERQISNRQQPTTSLPSTGRTKPQAEGLVQQRFKPEQIVDNNILDPSINDTGTLQYYNKQDGKFYKINANGEKELLSEEIFYNVEKVTWSPKDTKSIIEYPDGSNIYYDFANKKQVTLPQHWEEFTFETSGNLIAAKSMSISPENRWIIAADPEGNNIKLIASLGEQADKVNIDWSPNNQIIGTSRTGDALDDDRQEILFVGKNRENFKSMVVEGRGFESSWSPNGDRMLYSVYNARSDFKPELWIVDAQPGTIGDQRKLLNVNTWPEKCSFGDDKFLYCGVPKNLERGAGIAPEVADNTPDVIMRIDTQTGAKVELPVENDGHVVDKIFLGEDGKTMYFTDKRRPGIFKIQM